MADLKITQLTENTVPSTGDLLAIVNDPSGTPSTQKITVDNLGILSGWIPADVTWTYATASTFTISGVDVTAIFQPGTRIKLTQTTVKYFVVKGSSFSSDTTVTILTNTNYTLADAAITSPYYSYQVSPQGYPDWFTFDFDPELGTTNADNITVTKSQYMVIGKTLWTNIKYDLTGDPGSGNFRIIVPVIPINTYHYHGLAMYYDGSVSKLFFGIHNETNCYFYLCSTGAILTDAAPDTMANGDIISIQLCYVYAA